MSVKHWTEHRLVEPSTHTAIAVCIAIAVLWLETSTLESIEATKWLTGWAGFHALLGVVLKEGKGL
jgi:hypothetical protein